MATKKISTSTAVATVKPTNTSVVSVQEQLKAMLAAQMGKTQSSAKKVKYDSTTFTLPSGAMFQAPMKVVILDFNTSHIFYEGEYKKGEITPITCAAVGDVPAEMAPYSSIESPQCGDCNSCWANEFGSKGAGKACKQVRQIAFLAEDADGNIDPNGPINIMQTNVTANKVFDAYVKSVGSIYQSPLIGVVTTLGINNSEKWPAVNYTFSQLNEDLEACFSRLTEARAMLNEQVQVSAPAPAVPAKTVARGKPVAAAARR